MHFDLALEGEAKHLVAWFGSIIIEVCAFNETITKYSVLDQTVLTRQLSDDSTSERYGDGFVIAEESWLHSIVRCLKLAAGVRRSGEAQRYAFLMLKSLVASFRVQKRVGLLACNKDVRLCCLMQPIAASTHRMVVC